MNANLGTEKINTLLWSLSIPAILGMLSGAIFNVADRIFVGRINPLAMSGVGITMPVQILQMAIILLIGIGSSTLVSIRLGEDKVLEAEEILYLSFKYIILSMIAFAGLFLLFEDWIFRLLSISPQVYPYARPYIMILTLGAVIGMPGYCLNNSLRAIGKAKVTMQIILITSIINIILDPIFIFGLDMGIAGAAIATVISQTILTLYVTYYFITKKELVIHLRLIKVRHELSVLWEIIKNGSPSFYVQIMATLLNIYINRSFVKYGSDLDVAAITIITTVFSFYHMIIIGIVQGNQPICGYNWGSGQFDRVRESLKLSLFYATLLSVLLFAVIQLFPELLVSAFTQDQELRVITARGMRIYLSMLPLIGIQTISTHYFQAVGRPGRSNMLSFMRYGVIAAAITLLAPIFGVMGVYLSNALSDFIAFALAGGFIWFELRQLKKLSTATIITD